MARLNLTIADDLYERLERHRDRVNVSKICAGALIKELDMLDGTMAMGDDTKAQQLVGRFLRLRENKDRWYQRGRHDGEKWAIERASLDELRMMGDEWDEDNISDCDDLEEIDEDEFPTFNARQLLKQWLATDSAQGENRTEADWRSYLHGWYHAARDLWAKAKPALS